MPHIIVQPSRGRAAIRVGNPMMGTKYISATMPTKIRPRTQGLRHLLQEEMSLFIYFFPALASIITAVKGAIIGGCIAYFRISLVIGNSSHLFNSAV